MKTETKINGMEIEEAIELVEYHESNPFEWTMLDMEVEDIYEQLWDKDLCPHCGKQYKELNTKNYNSNINGDSGSESFELSCPNCNEIVDFIENIYY